MKYDEKRGVILVGMKEFVSVARRGISPTLPYDDEEPTQSEVGEKVAKLLLGDALGQNLSYEFKTGGYTFVLNGRADGIKNNTVTLIREVDSPARKVKKQEVAQIRGEGYILGKMYAEISGAKNLTLEFIYVSRSDRDTATVSETVSLAKLNSFFEKCSAAVGIYARPEAERVTERLPSMKSLKFPYSEVRIGQGDFVRAAYRTLAKGGTLYASAPTGTGKTVSALYPALKALGEERVDKVFYLTPKATTARAATECLELMAEAGAKIRGIVLTAKEKCCKGGLKCREDRRLCENSGLNNLPDAVMELYRTDVVTVTGDTVDAVAKKYKVCPYELQLAFAEIADVIICDFNYLFDPVVYIRRFFTEGGRYAFLIDEAHNLVERAREMYSAEFDEGEIEAAAESNLFGEFSPLKKALLDAKEEFYNILFPYLKDDLREDRDGKKYGAAHLSDIPPQLYGLFAALENTAEEELLRAYLATDEEKNRRVRLIRSLLYKFKKINLILSLFDRHYKLFLFYGEGRVRMKLFCLDTGKVVRERVECGHGAVFFSATLSPMDYYKSALGADGTSALLETASPFDPSQLSVSIMDKISTRYSERERTLPAICRVIAATLSAKRGNYMVFAPSFEYCDAISRVFRASYPKIKTLTQRKDMTPHERAEFLAEFERESENYLVGFCVMGGIYSEGVDLAGDSLIGAVVVGIGMPSLSYEREAMTEYYDEKFDAGKLYAYIYPGMNRVLQAAGRVIRREDDRGVIVLIDDRFDDPVYKKIIPDLWRGMRYVDDAKSLNAALKKFWAENG